jgi:4-aminobutyrate aminotransferase-like enzyme
MIDRMKENGVYALKSGNHSIRFRGMLDTPAEIIDKAVEIVGKSLPK